MPAQERSNAKPWTDWWQPWAPIAPWQAAWDYWVDATQRTILFWDVMRKRGNLFLERSGKPMRRRARGVSVWTAALVWLVTGAAGAQERPADTMEVLREKVRADRKLVVAIALDLTEGEAKGFWPVYSAYQGDMIVHYDRVAKLITDYTAAYQKMNDETATQLLGEFLALETDHAALLNRYVPRFHRALPPRKVARFYQIENKIRAVLHYQLARDIPLVK